MRVLVLKSVRRQTYDLQYLKILQTLSFLFLAEELLVFCWDDSLCWGF